LRLQGTWTDGQTDGRTDGWTDGRMDGRTDGRTDGQGDYYIPSQTLFAGGIIKMLNIEMRT
jgi:hypothetical protein